MRQNDAEAAGLPRPRREGEAPEGWGGAGEEEDGAGEWTGEGEEVLGVDEELVELSRFLGRGDGGGGSE